MIGRQRAYLRKMANTIDPVFQVGKAGVTPEVTDAIDQVLEAQELIKIKILKNSPYEVLDVCRMISERTHADLIQVIGRKGVLYRKSKENPVIVLPKI